MTRRFLWTSAILLSAAFAASIGADGQPPQGRGRGSVDLPEGPGKLPVQAYCTRCHQLGNIVNSGGYTREGWRQLISTMVALPPDATDTIVDYLARNFPEQPKPKAVVIAGAIKVAFKEWD